VIVIKNVLVATDFSPASESALGYGRALSRTFAARLHVIHVVDDVASRLAYADLAMSELTPGDVQAEIERASRQELERFVTETDRRELDAASVLRTGRSPAQEIVAYATEAAVDIIIVGATGRGVIDRLLMGSVADKVIRRAPCPVLAVRHPEREFIGPDALQVVTGTTA
jgi:nucleotide-binding universal stress UspA family protein